jgi:hypothetical protein
VKVHSTHLEHEQRAAPGRGSAHGSEHDSEHGSEHGGEHGGEGRGDEADEAPP